MKQQSELRKVFRAVHNALQELESMTPSKRKKTILSLMEINMDLEEKIIEHLNNHHERVSEDSPVHS